MISCSFSAIIRSEIGNLYIFQSFPWLNRALVCFRGCLVYSWQNNSGKIRQIADLKRKPLFRRLIPLITVSFCSQDSTHSKDIPRIFWTFTSLRFHYRGAFWSLETRVFQYTIAMFQLSPSTSIVARYVLSSCICKDQINYTSGFVVDIVLSVFTLCLK